MKAYKDSKTGIALGLKLSPDDLSKITCCYDTLEAYDENLIQIVKEYYGEVKDFTIHDLGDTLYQQTNALADALSNGETIKVNKAEKLVDSIDILCEELRQMNDHREVDVCVFFSQKGGPSFPMHSDDDVDVYLFNVVGNKRVFFEDGESIFFSQNECVCIPAGVRHRAEAMSDNIMLSFGVKRE